MDLQLSRRERLAREFAFVGESRSAKVTAVARKDVVAVHTDVA